MRGESGRVRVSFVFKVVSRERRVVLLRWGACFLGLFSVVLRVFFVRLVVILWV